MPPPWGHRPCKSPSSSSPVGAALKASSGTASGTDAFPTENIAAQKPSWVKSCSAISAVHVHSSLGLWISPHSMLGPLNWVAICLGSHSCSSHVAATSFFSVTRFCLAVSPNERGVPCAVSCTARPLPQNIIRSSCPQMRSIALPRVWLIWVVSRVSNARQDKTTLTWHIVGLVHRLSLQARVEACGAH